MEKIKRLVLIHLIVNVVYCALVFILAGVVRELSIRTFLPLILPWVVLTGSAFLIIAEPEAALAPVKKLNLLSLGVRGLTAIVLYFCIFAHGSAAAFWVLIVLMILLSLAGFGLDFLVVRALAVGAPESNSMFWGNIESIGKKSSLVAPNFNSALDKSTFAFMATSFGLMLVLMLSICIQAVARPWSGGITALFIIGWIVAAIAFGVAAFCLLLRNRAYYASGDAKKSFIIETACLATIYIVLLIVSLLAYSKPSVLYLIFFGVLVLLTPIYATSRKIEVESGETDKDTSDNLYISTKSESAAKNASVVYAKPVTASPAKPAKEKKAPAEKKAKEPKAPKEPKAVKSKPVEQSQQPLDGTPVRYTKEDYERKMREMQEKNKK